MPEYRSPDAYLHWSEAGGPNECEHGYAEGIPCPHCDVIPLVVSLRAENERLRTALSEMLESFTDPEDDNDILRRARAALGVKEG